MQVMKFVGLTHSAGMLPRKMARERTSFSKRGLGHGGGAPAPQVSTMSCGAQAFWLGDAEARKTRRAQP